MNDRELLELAAKAAKLDFVPSMDGGAGIVGGVMRKPWNPLADDGDALRLAINLRIDIEWCGDYEVCVGRQAPLYLHEEKNFCSAVRRAIVRAAAAIGEVMP